MLKKIISVSLVLLLLTSTALAFSDVLEDAWYYEDVMEMARQGVINGIGNGSFDPTGDLTVAAAIKLAVAARTAYYGESSIQIDSSEGHWVSAYYNYAKEHGMLEGSKALTEARFDTAITRGEMATLFAHVLDSSDYTQINDIKNADNPSIRNETDSSVILLYNAGVLIGNNEGFALNTNISRAETAAIINRVTNPSARKDTGTFNAGGGSSYVEETPDAPDSPSTSQNFMQRTLYVDEAYSGHNQTISQNEFAGSSRIDVKYNHTYNCANQQQYDAVMDIVQEAYDYVMSDYKPSTNLAKYFNGTLTEADLIKQGSLRYIVEAFDGSAQDEALMTYDQYSQILNRVKKLTKDQKVPTTSSNLGTSAYAYLFGGYSDITCEATSALNMAIFDVMGLNSAAYGSTTAAHQAAAVQLNGVWFIHWAQAGGFNTLDAAKAVSSDLTLDVYETFSSDLSCGGLYIK